VSLHVWLAFSVAALLISLSPGAGAISCMANGMRYGYRRSLPNIAGMQLGVALQLVVVGIGLGALLAASTLAFNLVKGLGVVYLCYLGWQQFRAEAQPVNLADADAAAGTPRALFVQGFLVNASNPKATIFLLAVLPQFIDPHLPAGHQLAVMCAVSVPLAALSDMGWAIAAGAGRTFFLRRANAKWLGRVSGLALIGGGVWLSLARRPG